MNWSVVLVISLVFGLIGAVKDGPIWPWAMLAAFIVFTLSVAKII